MYSGIVDKVKFHCLLKLMRSQAPKVGNPRRMASSFPAQRTGQELDLQEVAHQPVLQERPVPQLCLPVTDDAGWLSL